MYRRGDPAQIPPDRLHSGVNIRLANGEMGSRSGLAYVEGTQEDACITGIFEIDDRAVGIYLTKIAADTDHRILSFNEEKSPSTTQFWDQTVLGETREPTPYRDLVGTSNYSFRSFQRFRGAILFASNAGIFELDFSEDDNGTARMDATLVIQTGLAGSVVGSVTSMCVRRERLDDPQTGDELENDVLYIGTTDGKIYRYDGSAVELVHTLSATGPVDLLTYAGSWVIAAGDNGDGFAYQDAPGATWTNVAWGLTFECNGMCEWLGEVIFVGNDNTANKANVLRWAGSGSPTSFFTPSRTFVDCRSPVVAAGALHWVLKEPLDPQADHWFSRATDFSTITEQWFSPSFQQDFGMDITFVIPYRGAILFGIWGGELQTLHPSNYGYSINLLTSGAVPNMDIVEFFPGTSSVNNPFSGDGYQAIPI
jgi:hypothetical protein